MAVIAMDNKNPGKSLHQRLLSGGVWAVLFRVLAALSGLVVNGLIARLLLPVDVGNYFLIVSMVSVATMVAQMGMQYTVVRMVAEAMANGFGGRARGIVTTVLRTGFVSALIVGLSVGLGGHHLLAQLSGASIPENVMLYAAVWVVTMTLLGLLTESFRGFHDIRLAAAFTNLVASAILGALLFAAYQLLMSTFLRSVLTLSVIASCASLSLAAFAMHRKFSRLEKAEQVGIGTVIRHSAPLLVSSLAIFITTQADLWIISWVRSEDRVAVYGAAVRLVQFVAVPLMLMNTILPPFISELYSQGKIKQLENVIRISTTIASLPAILVLLAFVVESDMVLRLVYGDYYRLASTPLVILSIGQLINVWTGSGAMVLMMTGHQKAMMVISVSCGLVLVVGDLLVVRPYGINGVATVSASVTALQALVILSWVKFRIGMWTHGGFANMTQVLKRIIKPVSDSVKNGLGGEKK